MFESLSDKLHDVFRKLRGQSTLTEANIADAMREIRLALLEADVNINIASEFIEGVKAECVGRDVVRSVSPGQQVVKIVHDKLVELLGGGASELEFQSKPTVIMCPLCSAPSTLPAPRISRSRIAIFSPEPNSVNSLMVISRLYASVESVLPFLNVKYAYALLSLLPTRPLI